MTEKFSNKKAALAALEENPLKCVLWQEDKIEMSAIYWNGKRKIQPSDKPVN